ncbi:MAG: phosphoribosylglycinamide formyltransferase [Gammaproteobacteria bacterium]|nr:phosphoribosylglycinamide formyltransferase [Gammaproteobacteria bacterium]
MSETINLVVFISGNGSNLQAIIDAIESGRLNGRILAVISDQPDAFGLQRAQKHGIPGIILDHRNYSSRNEFDQALLQKVNQLRPDYIVLAGFMRILGSDFVQAYEYKVLNIHPSILPDFKGLDTHRRVLQNGEKEHGVSIHLVTAELDDGPVLLQGRYPVEKDDKVEDLQRKGHELEHLMFPALLQWVSEGILQINRDSIIYNNQVMHQPVRFQQGI